MATQRGFCALSLMKLIKRNRSFSTCTAAASAADHGLAAVVFSASQPSAEAAEPQQKDAFLDLCDRWQQLQTCICKEVGLSPCLKDHCSYLQELQQQVKST